MSDTPHAEVFAVQLQREGPQRISVRCPYCTQVHSHRVFGNDGISFTRVAPCTGDYPVLQYRIDLNARVPKRNVSQAHPVYTAGEDRDEVLGEYEHNWIE